MTDDEQALLALLGHVYLQNARPDKAAVVLAALDVLAPNQHRVLRSLALAQLRSDKPNRALDTLDRLAMAGGTDAAFHLLRAQALTALQRPEESQRAMQTYLDIRQREAKAEAAASAGADSLSQP
jgi:Flp pilus assembly protein TadD